MSSSGYGGNLTYPALKQFENSDLSNYTGYWDDKYDSNGGQSTPFIYEHHGKGTIPYIQGASSWKILWGQPSVAREMTVHLNDQESCAICPYDFGFGIRTNANKPGVFNSLFYGKVRPYYSTTKFLTTAAGKISVDDHAAQTAEIVGLIAADTGLGNVDTEQHGAVVLVKEEVPINYATGTATVKIPGLPDLLLTDTSSFGAVQSLITTAYDNYIYADATGLHGYYTGQKVSNDGGATFGGGNNGIQTGFTVVQTTTGATPAVLLTTDNKIHLKTKPEYQDEYSFIVEDLTEGSMATVDMSTAAPPAPLNGSFATMTSDDVFRTFSHRRNDRGFANMWRQAKPIDYPTTAPTTAFKDDGSANDKPISKGWYKLVLTTEMGTASIHGASHGNQYRQVMELYAPEISGTVGDAGGGVEAADSVYNYLNKLAKWWANPVAGTPTPPHWTAT